MSSAVPFEPECRATAAALGVAVEHIEVGAQNVVLISDDVVLRFPIRQRDADRLSELALRHRRAAEAGLRTPELLGQVDGRPGTAHLTMRRVDGLPLTAALARLDDRQRGRALRDVTDVLEALREVQGDRWPFVGQDWVALWGGLPARLDRLAHRLPRARLRDWHSMASQAAEVAASAPLGLMHGDLQDTNVRIGGNGRLASVLDWDSALIGDPAMDTAAVLHSVGPHAAALVASLPWLAEDMRRFEIYRSTWELQHALWRAGDDHWLYPSS